jgi:hypothetical protein
MGKGAVVQVDISVQVTLERMRGTVSDGQCGYGSC